MSYPRNLALFALCVISVFSSDIGGKEYLEELKKSEPDVFAKETPGVFMDSTQGNVPADANNLESQIFSGFGLKK